MRANPSRPSATGLRATGMIADAEAPAKLDDQTGPPAAARLDDDPAMGSGAFSSAICWPKAGSTAIGRSISADCHRFLILPVHRNRRAE